MEPSDCFCSAMKKDRDVVTGTVPAETEQCSNNYTSVYIKDWFREKDRKRIQHSVTSKLKLES